MTGRSKANASYLTPSRILLLNDHRVKEVVGPQIWSARGEPLMIQIITFCISAKTVKRLRRRIQEKTEPHNN